MNTIKLDIPVDIYRSLYREIFTEENESKKPGPILKELKSLIRDAAYVMDNQAAYLYKELYDSEMTLANDFPSDIKDLDRKRKLKSDIYKTKAKLAALGYESEINWGNFEEPESEDIDWIIPGSYILGYINEDENDDEDED